MFLRSASIVEETIPFGTIKVETAYCGISILPMVSLKRGCGNVIIYGITFPMFRSAGAYIVLALLNGGCLFCQRRAETLANLKVTHWVTDQSLCCKRQFITTPDYLQPKLFTIPRCVWKWTTTSQLLILSIMESMKSANDIIMSTCRRKLVTTTSFKTRKCVTECVLVCANLCHFDQFM